MRTLGGELRRVFWRVDHPVSLNQWGRMVDSLLHSDPVECLEFMSELLLTLAARLDKDPAEAVDTILDGLREATIDHPQFESVFELVSSRHKDLFSQYSEFGNVKSVQKAVYQLAREAPWPDS